MWEGLARTQRQDRLHGAAKLANLAFGLPAGRHGVLEAIDPTWTCGVYRAFFELWAIYAERSGPSRGATTEMVYSATKSG